MVRTRMTMKSCIHYGLALTVLAGLALSCQKKEEDFEKPVLVSEEAVTVSFLAGTAETRTTFQDPENGFYPTVWTENDAEVSVSLNLGKPRPAEVIPSANHNKATFSVSYTDPGDGPYSFYVVSPSTSVLSISESRKSWNIMIPAIQTPSAVSVDESAQVLVGKSEGLTDLATTVDVMFDHLTAYGRFALKNVGKALKNVGYEGATVLSVDFTSQDPFAGSWYYNVEDASMTPKDPSYTVTVKLGEVADLDMIENVWFSCLPVDMSEKTLTIRVNTDKGSIERTVTFPAGRAFSAGKVIRFTANMESATIATTTVEVPEVVYKLVTSLDEIDEDDYLVLANSNTNPTYLLGSSSSSRGIAGLAAGGSTFTVGADGHIRLSADSEVSRLIVYGKSGSTLELFDWNNGVFGLNAASSSYSLGWDWETLTDWSASIASAGVLGLSCAMGKNTTYYVSFSNGVFTTVTKANSASPLAFYKKTVIYTETTYQNPLCDENDAILSENEYGAYLNDSNRQIYTRPANQLSREYGSSTVTFAILTPAAGRALEFSGIPAGATKDDTFRLTLCRYEDADVEYLQSFDVIVVKEEGPKLWLSAGAGIGFIVKK